MNQPTSKPAELYHSKKEDEQVRPQGQFTKVAPPSDAGTEPTDSRKVRYPFEAYRAPISGIR